MGIEQSNPSTEPKENDKEGRPLKSGNIEPKNLAEIKENSIVHIIYSLDKNLFGKDQCIILFGNYFFSNNKNKCKMIIAGKDYEIKNIIKAKEFKKYGIKEEDEELEVILKSKQLLICHICFAIVKV